MCLLLLCIKPSYVSTACSFPIAEEPFHESEVNENDNEALYF
jgi:hypothetical protein